MKFSLFFFPISLENREQQKAASRSVKLLMVVIFKNLCFSLSMAVDAGALLPPRHLTRSHAELQSASTHRLWWPGCSGLGHNREYQTDKHENYTDLNSIMVRVWGSYSSVLGTWYRTWLRTEPPPNQTTICTAAVWTIIVYTVVHSCRNLLVLDLCGTQIHGKAQGGGFVWL